MKTVLELENVVINQRKGDWALHLPDISVSQGQYRVNPELDSGLTRTLQQVLSGETTIASGDLRLLGVPLQHASRRTLRRLRRSIAFISANEGVLAGWSVQQNVSLPLIAEGAKSRARRKQITAVLTRFGLLGLASIKANQLTMSQRSLVSLAQAVVKSPLLVLAERCWGDEVNIVIESSLRDLARNGSAVLVEGAHQPQALVEESINS